MRRILLASTSPYRKALLESLGVAFHTARPLIDEDVAKKDFPHPLEMAQGLARLKAESLKAPDCVVIGGDQLVSLGEEILGKPHTEERALQQLLKMQGRTHEIITAVCVCTPETNIEFVDITRMSMKPLTSDELLEYIREDQPLDCAGSYKIEKSGRRLFSEIQSEDFSAIEGLPLRKLAEVLQTLGYGISKKFRPH
ncbi:MAG: Maf family protein [Bdellovibrionales bacterium]